MKTLFRPSIPLASAALFALTLAGFAQPAAPAERSAPAASATAAPEVPPAPAAETPKVEPAAPTPAAAVPAAPAPAVEPAPEAERPAAEPLRRLDVPSRASRRRGPSDDVPFGNHTVPAGGRAQELVSLFGSSTVDGELASDVVSVFGDTVVGPEAKVGGAAVAVLGRLTSQGDVHEDTVSVLGGSDLNGHVGGDAVSVLGNMKLGPNAVVDGDIVVVAGRLTRDPNAVVRGNQVHVTALGALGDAEWMTTWFKRCLIYGRPLAFGAYMGWAWALAFSFLAFYLLLALLFPRGIVKCAETLERRPGYSILWAFLTTLLAPVAIVLLAVTVVGALLVPFLGAALVFAGLFGKAVMAAWVGRRFGPLVGGGALSHPALHVLLGGLVVLAIYTVPIFGGIVFVLFGWLGLGVVVCTIGLSMRREKPPAAPAPVIPPTPPPYPVSPATAYAPVTPVPPVVPMAATAPSVSPGFAGAAATAEIPVAPEFGVPPVAPMENVTPPPMPPPEMPFSPPPIIPPGSPAFSAASAVPPVSAAVAWPRAGFFIRLGAMALDGVLVGMVLGFSAGILPRFLQFNHGPGGWLLALAIYGAIMWKLKGTTVGGIVCGLKVVRVDNRELDWPTSIVRALGCFLSLAVAGLGFIWVAIDDERQSWHDKIAGTTVVRVPKGISLL